MMTTNLIQIQILLFGTEKNTDLLSKTFLKDLTPQSKFVYLGIGSNYTIRLVINCSEANYSVPEIETETKDDCQ